MGSIIEPSEGAMNLTETEIVELQRRASGRTERADSARRARLILLLADGLTWAEIRGKLDCSDSYIDRWSFFFQAEDGIRVLTVTGVQTCALPIWWRHPHRPRPAGGRTSPRRSTSP